MFERRTSEVYKEFNMSLSQVNVTGMQDHEYVWVLKDFWTTHKGSWEVDTSDPWSLPQWARDDYLTDWGHECNFDDAGSDHSVFAAFLPEDFTSGPVGCALLKNAGTVYWTDINDLVATNTKEQSGWAHVNMYASSKFFPDKGETGPWSWCKGGKGYSNTDVIIGAGLPYQNHVSFFAVWQKMTVLRYKEHILGDNPIDPPIDPPVEPPIVSPPHPGLPPTSNDCCEEMAKVSLAAIDSHERTINRLIDELVKP